MTRKPKPEQPGLYLGDMSALRIRIDDWRARVMPTLRAVELNGRRIALDDLADADTPAVADALREVDARIKATMRACARARARLALQSIPHA